MSAAYLSAANSVSSQAVITFERTYGGIYADFGYSVQQTSDGGYVVVGMTSSPGADWEDIYLVKTDSLGDTLWAKTYGGKGREWGYALQQSTDGGYVLTGYTSSVGPGEMSVYLIRTDSFGNVLWEKTYGGVYTDAGTCLQRTADGGYVVGGWSCSYGAGDYDVYLVRTDNVGNELWAHTYGGSGHDYGSSIEQTSDGGLVIVGSTNSFGAGGYDVYLIRTDPAGSILWDRTYGGPDDDYGYSVEMTPDGGYILAGETFSFGAGEQDVYLIRADSLGSTLWTRTYGGCSSDVARSIHQTTDSGYVITGGTQNPDSGYYEVLLLRTDSSGEKLWSRTYGGPYGDGGLDVKPTSDGGYVIAGLKGHLGAGQCGYVVAGLKGHLGVGQYCDVYLIKTDALGRVGECQPVEPWQMKSQGYWTRQCKDDSHEDICSCVDSVHALTDLFDAFDCDSICHLMRIDPPERDMCRKARRQFMALLLNIASGKLALCNCLEYGREVRDVVAEIDSLLAGHPDFATCRHAKTLADDINNGFGIVPCDTLWSQVTPRSVEARDSNRSIMVGGNRSVPAFQLCQSVPSPFFSRTRISYQIPEQLLVKLTIYDIRGRLVKAFIVETQSAGSYTVEWRGDDDLGHALPAGVYLYRLDAGPYSVARKTVLVR